MSGRRASRRVRTPELVERVDAWDPEWSPARDLDACSDHWRNWFPRLSTRRYVDGSERFYSESGRRLGNEALQCIAALQAAGWTVSVFPGHIGDIIVQIEELAER